MNKWCICWLFTHILLGILIFKGLTARRLYKSFGVKWLTMSFTHSFSITMLNICAAFLALNEWHSVTQMDFRGLFYQSVWW
jgi:hypothetical protein